MRESFYLVPEVSSVQSFPRKFILFAFGFLCLAFVGCGGTNVVPVSGTLTYKGKPVTNAFINFVPEKGRPSMGETDQQGNFVMTYDPQTKGVEVGKHRVFVQHNVVADQSRPGSIPGMPAVLPSDQRSLFEKYGGTKSKIEITVDRAIPDLKLDWD